MPDWKRRFSLGLWALMSCVVAVLIVNVFILSSGLRQSRDISDGWQKGFYEEAEKLKRWRLAYPDQVAGDGGPKSREPASSVNGTVYGGMVCPAWAVCSPWSNNIPVPGGPFIVQRDWTVKVNPAWVDSQRVQAATDDDIERAPCPPGQKGYVVCQDPR